MTQADILSSVIFYALYEEKNIRKRSGNQHFPELGKEKKMPRMSKLKKQYWAFFLNDKGRITYNDLCRKCQRDCKQSFRAVIERCPVFSSKRNNKKNNAHMTL